MTHKLNKNIWNLPNILTVLRIIIIPVIVLLFYLPFQWSHYFTAGLFFLAGFTDWLDGYLARTWQQTSKFGSFLDPVADKLLVVVTLMLLVGDKTLNYIVLPALIIVGREVVISALREWMAELGQRTNVKVNFIAKAKTMGQMGAIFFLMLHMEKIYYPITALGYTLLYVSAILTVWSMVIYLKAAWPTIMADD